MIKYISTHPVYIKTFIKNKIKCFNIYKPIHTIPNILNEENIDLVIHEIVKNKDFEKQISKYRHMNQ